MNPFVSLLFLFSPVSAPDTPLSNEDACMHKEIAARRKLLCLFAEKKCGSFKKPAAYAMPMSGYYPRDRNRCQMIIVEPEFESLNMSGEVCGSADAFSNVYGFTKFQGVCRAAAQAMARSGL